MLGSPWASESGAEILTADGTVVGIDLDVVDIDLVDVDDTAGPRQGTLADLEHPHTSEVRAEIVAIRWDIDEAGAAPESLAVGMQVVVLGVDIDLEGAGIRILRRLE